MAIAFLILSASLPAEPMFPGYDITFFRTITDSLMVNDDKRFGIDYTGYGFVGEEMTTGVYMRIGLQAPYSSLSALFEDEEEESEIEAKLEELAKAAGKTLEEYKKDVTDSQREYLANDIVVNKLFDFLKANNDLAVAEEKPAEEAKEDKADKAE